MKEKRKLKKEQQYIDVKKRRIIPQRYIFNSLLIISQIALWVLFMYGLTVSGLITQTLYTVVEIIFIVAVINKDEPPEYKTPWLLTILLIPIVGAVVYLLFGGKAIAPKAKKRFEKNKLSSKQYFAENKKTCANLKQNSEQGAAISQYISNTCGMPVYCNTQTQYYSSGESFFEALKSDLKQAKSFVFMEYFIITPGFMWSEIYNILKEKVSCGVKVYILYDDIGSAKHTPYKFDKLLNSRGINCCKFNPYIPVASSVHNNRDHRKITVIDGQIAYTGGVNIADEYINKEQPYGHWKDSAVRLQGDAAKSFAVCFIEMYNFFAKNTLNVADFIEQSVGEKVAVTTDILAINNVFAKNQANQTLSDGRAWQRESENIQSENAESENVKGENSLPLCGYVQPYVDGPAPVLPEYIAKNVYLSIIYGAKKYLYIATPYLIMGFEAEEALIIAARRGVDVRIITPHTPDKKYVFTVTRSAYLKLINAGVKIYEYEPGFIHSKIIISDDEIATIGTVNFDYRSFIHHYECGVLLIKTPCLSEIKKDYILTAEKQGILQTPQSAKLSLGEKITKTVMGLFTPLL